jgi:hypothetical protein
MSEPHPIDPPSKCAPSPPSPEELRQRARRRLLKVGLYVAPSVLLLDLPWLTFTSQVASSQQRVTVRQRIQADVTEAVRIKLLVDTSVQVQVGDTVQIRANVNPE